MSASGRPPQPAPVRSVAVALLALGAAACGAAPGAAPAPEPLAAGQPPADTATPRVRVVTEVVTPEDSALDQAMLQALGELEFGRRDGLGRVGGAVPLPAGPTTADVHAEAARLFRDAPGGAAGAARPTYDIDVESYAANDRVQYYVEFFLGRARDRFQIWVGRLNRYEGMIRAQLLARGMPEDLVYLAMIESGYSNTAVSRAGAVGMWQFMASTGRRYGLVVDEWVDERRDPFRATDAAARHLSDLNEQFGSLYLAAAAYNAGAGRVSRGIRRLPGERDSLTDGTFFALADRRYLKLETRDYVPKLIAAALIAKEPVRYGFDSVPYLEPLVFDEVRVDDMTGLDVLARLADTTVSALVELNPQYHRGVTPPRRASTVRVPRGAGTLVAARYAALPPSERVTFVHHVIARGETLSEIARRYGVSVALVTSANPGLEPRRLRVGHRLTIPVSTARKAATASAGPRVTAPPAAAAGRHAATHHTVRAGESLWSISQRYGVRISDLRKWNDLETDEVLRAGVRLVVAPPPGAASSR